MPTINKTVVLLAAYNGYQYLAQQLDSILSQTVSVDIYISLDLSTDDSLKLIEDYTLRYPQVKMLNYGQRYGSAGSNFFRLILDVDFEKYDFVSFSDQDDIWFNTKIERAIHYINRDSLDAYSSNVTAFWSDGRTKLIKKNQSQTKFDYIFESSGPGCTFVMKKALVVDIKSSLSKRRELIDSLWLHDWYCYAFARSRSYKWFIDSASGLLYRQHDTNEVGANSGLKPFISRAKKILNGYGVFKVIQQCRFLVLDDSEPVKLLYSSRRIDLLKLSIMAPCCRRKLIDKVFFFFVFFWFFIIGFKFNEEE